MLVLLAFFLGGVRRQVKRIQVSFIDLISSIARCILPVGQVWVHKAHK